MAFYEHIDEWLGYPVVDYDPSSADPVDYAGTIYRIGSVEPIREGLLRRRTVREGVTLPDAFEQFVAGNTGEHTIPAIVFGMGEYMEAPTQLVSTVIQKKDSLANLRGIFLSDIIQEEVEVSWLPQCDVTPLLEAFPGLEHLRLRGSGDGLMLRPLRHIALRSLTFETGGLKKEILTALTECVLPGLEHLELYIGTEDYGGDIEISSLSPFTHCGVFPNLKHLGLRNAEHGDAVAELVATAPILDVLETLDLSLGTLGDKGAAFLLESPRIRRLKKLDLHRHYMSESVASNLATTLSASDVEVDVSDRQEEEDDFRYPAITE